MREGKVATGNTWWWRGATLLLVIAVMVVLPVIPVAASQDTAGIGVVDPDTGVWYLRDPASGATTSFYFGVPGDEPFVGDWDCNGTDTPGLYRRSDGYVYLRNSNSQGAADVAFYFGNPGDQPVVGDFDGNGCDSVSIYRPSEATFYVINRLGSAGAGLGPADFSFPFGLRGDQPLAGDFNGNAIDTVGVFRPSQQHIHLTGAPGVPGASFPFGTAADRVVVGAWTGSADQLAAHRGGGFFLTDAAGGALSELTYGNDTHLPLAGRFGNLPGGDPAPPDQPPYPNVGSGKRIIYSNSQQRIWLIEGDGTLAKTHQVSGRQGVPAPGTYAVFSKSPIAYSHHGITMKNMVRFAHGRKLSYGFHEIPVYANGAPMQTETQLGTFRSAGCVRQAATDAAFTYGWAGIGTTVHVLP
jgi:lipoprotein-anchoring transpeptidase ErfK/SrfK